MEGVCAMFKAKLIRTIPKAFYCCCDLQETQETALKNKLTAFKISLNEEKG